MRLIAIGKSQNEADRLSFERLQDAEAKALWEFYAAGILLEAHFCHDWCCSMLVLECQNAAEAKQVLARLPTAKSGLYHYELSLLKPFPALAEILAEHNVPAPQWLQY